MATNALARTDLEALLRARKLDRTVTRLPENAAGAAAPTVCAGRQDTAAQVLPTGIAPLDERLGGGLPRGLMSEIVGPRSSGRATLMSAVLAAATGRGALAALVDTLDMFDPGSASSCGIVLDRLLWLRGESTSVGSGGLPAASVYERRLDRALKALNMILQAGLFDLAVLDLAEVPWQAIRRLPFSTWLRLQRVIEGSRTVCLLTGPAPVARSAEGVSLQLARAGDRRHGRTDGGEWSARLFLGLDIDARIVRSRVPDAGACALRLRA